MEFTFLLNLVSRLEIARMFSFKINGAKFIKIDNIFNIVNNFLEIQTLNIRMIIQLHEAQDTRTKCEKLIHQLAIT